MSAVILDLLRKSLDSSGPRADGAPLRVRAGFPLFELPCPVTTDDVYRADDE